MNRINPLFKTPGFSAYIFIMFLNAMTDLGHKITLQNVIFKAFEGQTQIILTAVVNGLILLPFILLFSPAGYISDQVKKTKIIELSSLAAIVITTLILISYWLGMFYFAFGLTLLLAAQSAIYSPAKYGLIKSMVGEKRLAQGNAVVQAITIVSILLGALFYSVAFRALLSDQSRDPNEILQYIAPIGILLVLSSIVEYIFAKRLHRSLAHLSAPKSMPTFNPKNYLTLSYLKENISAIFQRQAVWRSILGLSALWGVAQILVAIFGEFLEHKLQIDNVVVAQGILTLSGVGMIVGSLLSGRLSRDHIDLGSVPLGALGITVVLFMLPSLDSLTSMSVAIFIFGFSAGLILVPLNSLIQYLSAEKDLGKTLAGNNFVQNLVMFSFLGLTAAFAYFDVSVTGLFYFAATIAGIGALFSIIRIPQSLVRYVGLIAFSLRYKLHVQGFEHLNVRENDDKSQQRGKLLLGNHISFLDWAFLQMAYPKQIRYVIHESYYKRWYKPVLDFFKVIPIGSGNKAALQRVTDALNQGDTVAIFPEGHLSRNGQMSQFKGGFEIAASGATHADIIPFYLRGLWENNFSHASHKLKRKNSRNIIVSFGQSLSIDSNKEQVKQAVFDLSIESWQHYTMGLPSLQEGWIESVKETGFGLCMADSTGAEVNAYKFATGVFMIGSKIRPQLKDQQNIGLLMPSSVGGSIANMAVLSQGKTVVNLNYTAGNDNVKGAIDSAKIKTVISSKLFLKRLVDKGFDLSDALNDVNVILLEDIRPQLSKVKGLLTLLNVMLTPASLLSLMYITPRQATDTAAILFSSGSEGTPKGIELTHQNLNANVKQALNMINPSDQDIMLGTLPTFHAFGLTATTLFPLVEGVPCVYHPDPTDGFNIGIMAARYQATILFATATFLRLYSTNKKLQPLMFNSLRLIVSGAEKLPQHVREGFESKFNKAVFEAYGATETAPACSTNLPDTLMTDSWQLHVGNKVGTVGMPLPGTSFRIVDPDSFEELPIGEDGMILIGGAQVMKGYLNDPEKTAEVIKEIDGVRWYVTGDKGHIDSDGFLTIVDRFSRFAKIGGEMVSLTSVEQHIGTAIRMHMPNSEAAVAVAAIADDKKGEKLVMMAECEGEDELKQIQQLVKGLDINPLYKPSKGYIVDTIPKLGSGKVDFKALKAMAQALT